MKKYYKLPYFWRILRDRHIFFLGYKYNEDIHAGKPLRAVEDYIISHGELMGDSVVDTKMCGYITKQVEALVRIRALSLHEDRLTDLLWRIQPSICVGDFISEERRGRDNGKTGVVFFMKNIAYQWVISKKSVLDFFLKLPFKLKEWVEFNRSQTEPDSIYRVRGPYSILKPHHRDKTPWSIYIGKLEDCPADKVCVTTLKDLQDLFPTQGAFGTMPQSITYQGQSTDPSTTLADMVAFITKMCTEGNHKHPLLTYIPQHGDFNVPHKSACNLEEARISCGKSGGSSSMVTG